VEIKVCDVCFADNGKVTKAVKKVTQTYHDNHVRVSADVCEEHAEFFATLGPDEAVSKITKLMDKVEKKKKKGKDEETAK
jgi:hypothetical protein